MRAVLAAVGLVCAAVLLWSAEPSRGLFSPGVISVQTSSSALSGLAQQGHAEAAPFIVPVSYVEPVNAEASVTGSALSNVAMLAIFGALLGAAVSYQSGTEDRSSAVAEPDLELARSVALLAVGGQEALPTAGPSAAKDELVKLASDLNPIVGYWDPLNLAEANFWDQGNEATVGFLRHAEIKHGRVAMAAFVGYIVHANGIHFPWKMPGDELCAPGVSPVELWENLPRLAKTQIILVLGWFEYYGEAGLTENPKLKHYMRGGKPGVYPNFKEEPFPAPHPVPFDLFDPFGLQKGKSEEWKATRLRIELNNGRLAMLGIMAFLSEGAIPGSVPALQGLIKPTGVINVMDPFNFATCTQGTCVENFF